MKVYLVDFENVRSQGLVGISNISSRDKVIIFFSNSAGSVSFDILPEILKSECQIEFIKIFGGSQNALDFQLSSYLGYLISKRPKSEYIIVSKDHGFNVVVKFWEDKYKVSQIPELPKETTPEK